MSYFSQLKNKRKGKSNERAHVALKTNVEAQQDFQEVDVGDITASLTAVQFQKGILTSNPSGGAINLTTPSAALMIATDVKYAAVGKGFHVYLRNEDGVNAITILGGTGVTLKGNMVVAANAYSHFYLRYTNVSSGSQAYEFIRLA